MSIVDHSHTIQVPYTPEDTYEALKLACQSRKLWQECFTVDRYDDILKTVYLKASMSLFSWGELITVAVTSEGALGSKVTFRSTPKTGAMFGGAFDLGKNEKNLHLIEAELSKQLTQFVPVPKDNDHPGELNIYDEIERLAELKEKGILSADEFNTKKKQLLGL